MFWLIVLTQLSIAQTKGIKPVKKTNNLAIGKTLAVIVGISDYQDENIPDLRFAHRDAELFAEYLRSKEGGAVPASNITLLTNEDATSGKFISALYGLLEDCKEGDQIIIYFSGHGDVESSTISQPGFLLCWDAPSRIYMSGGTFGLAYFQEIISTIASKTQSQVMVVTDACRAGKLAGSEIGGAQATAAHLAKQYANEIKILSCQPNEYALESETWGGGRGVFSYYFLRGIRGLADQNEDNIVTLTEISRYLEDMVTPAVDPHSQIPMVVGNRKAKISNVDLDVLSTLKEQSKSQNIATINAKSLELDKEDFVDTTRYANYEAFQLAIADNHLLYPEEGSAWEIFHLIKDYEELNPYIGLMRRNLAAALQDDSQQAINRYISGDEEEIRRRLNGDTNYGQFTEQLDKATQLLGEDHFYYSPLRARFYYYKGFVTRLDAENRKSDSLYNLALALQDSCLSYQKDAVYSLNEKGYTYYLKDDYSSSLNMYKEAERYINNWPLLLTNMSSTYLHLEKIDSAKITALKALEIDSNFILGNMKLATSLYANGNVEEAIKYYEKTIRLDSSMSFVYFRLGYIYSELGDYDKAVYFGEKSLKYDSTNLTYMINLAHYYLELNQSKDAKKYFLLAKELHPETLEAIQGVIEYYFFTGKTEDAKNELIDYLKFYPDDEYAYYLVSSIYAEQELYLESYNYLEKALLKGFDDVNTINEDENFKILKEEKKFIDLLIKYGLN